MSSLGSPNSFFLAGKKAYEVNRSLRFNHTDSTELKRTVSSTGNQKVWTWSAWFKRWGLHDNGGTSYLFSCEPHSGNNGIAALYIQSDQIYTYFDTTGSNPYGAVNDRKYRDVSAWMHIVWQVDAANTTQRIWINGVEETLASGNNPPDYAYGMNESGQPMMIGSSGNWGGSQSNTYFAEIHYSDGYKYAASDFAETNVITGQWVPKSPSISYGTNGFYLNFSDNSGTSSTTLGKDSSGNGNNFTPNNFSVSAGVGNDSVEDTPTNNFATLNPLALTATGATFSNGNLDYKSDGNYSMAAGNFSIKTGKWYWEVTITASLSGSNLQVNGIVRGTNPNANSYVSYDTNGNVFGIGYYFDGHVKGAAPDGSTNGATTATGLSTYNQNDVVGFATDIANGTLAFYKNGSLVHTVTGIASHDWFPAVSGYGTSSTNSLNFGQRPFAHTPPTGYKALSSANLPDPTILLPNKHFDTVLYTGTGSSNAITGLNFAPDWVWAKRRNASGNHHLLIDQLRGGDKSLSSNLTDAENSNANRSMTFNSNGVTWNSDTGNANASGGTYVLWNWNAGDTDGKTYTVTVVSDSGNKYRFDGFGTSVVTLDLAEGGTYIFNYPSAHPLKFSTTSDGTHGGGSEYTTGVTHNSSTQVTIVVAASAPTLYYYCSIHSGMGGQVNTNSTLGSSNFDGSLQAKVKANASAGFSIGIYTAQSSGSATVGHGLGVAPDVVITKSRTLNSNWYSYHQAIGQDGWILLDSSGAATTGNSAVWNPAPTSSVFTYGSGLVNQGDIVFYAFSEVAGYSKFGSYTGNGNADGTFVFTGFRPAFILTKRSDGTSPWRLFDNKRPDANFQTYKLEADSSGAELTGYAYADFLSNGFKIRDSGSYQNASGGTYIYLAFAEAPFRNARAR